MVSPALSLPPTPQAHAPSPATPQASLAADGPSFAQHLTQARAPQAEAQPAHEAAGRSASNAPQGNTAKATAKSAQAGKSDKPAKADKADKAGQAARDASGKADATDAADQADGAGSAAAAQDSSLSSLLPGWHAPVAPDTQPVPAPTPGAAGQGLAPADPQAVVAGESAAADDGKAAATGRRSARDAAVDLGDRAGAAREAGRKPGAQKGTVEVPAAPQKNFEAELKAADPSPQAQAQAPALLAEHDKPAGERSAAAVDAAGALAAALPSAAPSSTAATHSVAAPFEAQLSAAPGTPEFAPALGVQVTVLAREGVQEARLHLNPADMGPIAVQIAVDGAQAQVHFQADVAATRQALQDSLADLAAALREGGFTLAGGGVSDQRREGAAGQRTGEGSRPGLSGVQGASGADPVASAAAVRVPRAQGVVDLYA